jgi:hypothetical protein
MRATSNALKQRIAGFPGAEAIVTGDLASLQRMGFAVDGPIVLRRISENQSRIAPMCM